MMEQRKFVLNAKQLRKAIGNQEFLKGRETAKKNDIYIILDDVLDTYNIGSIFRLADAVAAKKIYLCARTETPPNHRIKKASINTTEVVDWEYGETGAAVIRKLRKKVPNLQVIAIEQSKKSIPYDKFNYKLPVCLIVGNETSGVSKKVLEEVDAIVEIPMFGVNISLNVMVSLGIVLYQVVSKCL